MEYVWSKRLTAKAASVGTSVGSLFGRQVPVACVLSACMYGGGACGRVCLCSAVASGSDIWD